ncbi:betaine/proline/choline family ABC transporter ATP-binding protein [Nocardioides bruguierae]|uniref:ABC-type quaternary amine transporter n=1 Tax=Nocardioides bruguierae TaxID=2945102 RepID=A0A9X2IEA5_9ACTN|nr:betaine/proline/choline family ABC transporter ATP-binding protein [Nocardioides bruguierae]MCL8024150.1 betaine/proline/choline family ABC transporter ATP-binding protein [Nocardioides bruguierae]MCM0619853.1 betaine/proline/choline family ABC transporter ATP-binding protein [Nocardioides bruguierae]
MNAQAKIHLDRVVKKYPGSKVPAVEELTLDIPEGEILVLVGPSGCGKSTTLRLINRMIEPSGGRILLDGEDVTKANPDKLRRRIGYVIQQVGLFPHHTIADNIATIPKMLKWDKKRITERVDYLLDTVGLPPEQYRDRYPRELSGGQAQRVGVARALGADPDIMLMDEPFGAIDPITRERLQNEFLRLQEEMHKTIVFVTHDIDEAIKMGDRIAILGERSTIRQYDTPERILAYPVDDFVNDFIGNGSTIKGLNFLQVSSLRLSDYPALRESESAAAGLNLLQEKGRDWLVVLDGEGRPVRWASQEQLGQAGTGDMRGVGVEVGDHLKDENTLFEALELMVQSAAGRTCVVDDAGQFQGIVDMGHLNKAIRTAQSEARRHYEELEANA